jgi:hypothetical protein
MFLLIFILKQLLDLASLPLQPTYLISFLPTGSSLSPTSFIPTTTSEKTGITKTEIFAIHLLYQFHRFLYVC